MTEIVAMPEAVETPRAPGAKTTHSSWQRLALIALAGLAVSLALGALAAYSSTFNPQLVAFAAAAVLGVGALVPSLTQFEWFVMVLLVVRPVLDLLHIGNGGITAPASSLGALFIVASIVWLVRRRRQATAWVPISGVTWAILLATTLLAISVVSSALPTWSAQGVVRVVAGVLMFVVLEQLFAEGPVWVFRVFWAVVLSAVIPTLLGVYQAIHPGPGDVFVGDVRSHGTFVHPNVFATYLVVVLVMCVGLMRHLPSRQRVIVSLVIAVGLFALLKTLTRAAWMALLIGLCYMIWHTRRKLLLLAVPAIAALPFAAPTVLARITDLSKPPPVAGAPGNSLAWRLGYWAEILPFANRNPVTGIGWDVVEKSTSYQLPPHNIYIQAYVESGVLGLFGMVAALVGLVIYLRRRRLDATDELSRSIALIGSAIGIGLLMQTVSENILSETTTLWYFAAAIFYGWRPGTSDRVALGDRAAIRDRAVVADGAAVGPRPPEE